MKCKNCDQEVKGNFCSFCGQSIKVGKINLPNFLGELSDTIFQINRGFFYTLKELFVRPGHSIREYLSGKRKNHFKPIAYALTLSTIYFLLSRLLESDTFVSDVISGWSADRKVDAKELATLNWFAKNYAYTILLLLPIYALSTHLAFLKSGFNYLEHFVLNAYIIGQQAIIYSFFSVLGLVGINRDALVSITVFISILYAFIVFRQFFSNQKKGAVVLRTFLSYVLFLIMFTLIWFIILSISLVLQN